MNRGVMRCTVCGQWGNAYEMIPVMTLVGRMFPTQTTRWFHRTCADGDPPTLGG